MALKNMSRRDMLKSTTGLFALGGILDYAISAEYIEEKSIDFEGDDNIKVPDKPLTFIVIGAGNRGNVYASYALKYPKEMKIVGEAEPILFRNERFAKKYDIDGRYRFDTWEDVFKVKKFADAVIITTPDHLHYGPAMEALDMGYDVILEKVVAQTWQECNDILKSAKKNDRIVAVCHVLRYTPYFRKMKEIVDSGTLGELVSIMHLEPVGHVHYAHSFVRGNWRNTAESNPMILSKSCHDLDILRWLIGKPCKLISSFGSQTLCKAENAPEGSTDRCTNGCKIEPQCPFSALKIYYRNHTWLSHFDLPEEGDRDPAILKAIKEGQYGRCVYHCDNDVVDHQVVSMEFEDSITANFSMEAFTHYGGRRTRIMFTMGDIVGDSEDLIVGNFRTDKVTKWNVKENAKIDSGHGGGDYRLVRDFIQAVNQRDPRLLTSTIDASMESHLMGFMAEKSRHENKIMKVDMTM